MPVEAAILDCENRDLSERDISRLTTDVNMLVWAHDTDCHERALQLDLAKEITDLLHTLMSQQ